MNMVNLHKDGIFLKKKYTILVLVSSIIAAPKVQHNYGAPQLMRINNASWSLRYGAHNSCST
jgi:hypothetical protein